MGSVVQFHFFGANKASTLVILNPLQRVKNPHTAEQREKSSGFFALRAQNDVAEFFLTRTNPACAKLHHHYRDGNIWLLNGSASELKAKG